MFLKNMNVKSDKMLYNSITNSKNRCNLYSLQRFLFI